MSRHADQAPASAALRDELAAAVLCCVMCLRLLRRGRRLDDDRRGLHSAIGSILRALGTAYSLSPEGHQPDGDRPAGQLISLPRLAHSERTELAALGGQGLADLADRRLVAFENRGVRIDALDIARLTDELGERIAAARALSEDADVVDRLTVAARTLDDLGAVARRSGRVPDGLGRRCNCERPALFSAIEGDVRCHKCGRPPWPRRRPGR